MDLYYWIFLVLGLFLIILKVKGAQFDDQKHVSLEFYNLKRTYLIVYSLMLAADWLQGPVVYILYKHYGFTHKEIGKLYFAGFAASCVGGVLVGPLVDGLGRKNGALAYMILYIASCLTKHFNDYSTLIMGRILGGLATSLLFSTFDAWYIAEHTRRRLPESLISDTLSSVTTMNSAIAIISGLVAQLAINSTDEVILIGDARIGYYTAPFDVAIICLAAGGILASVMWGENWGNRQAGCAAISDAWLFLVNNPSVMALGVIQGLFEGAMYCFVFIWTPALGDEAPHGVVFATFMVACALGSHVFKVMDNPFVSLNVACILGTLSLSNQFFSITDHWIRYFGFILFEITCGIYFPSIGTLKSQHVSEQYRATIYNIFRVPMNLIVTVVLIGEYDVETTIMICLILLFSASTLTTHIRQTGPL